MNTVNIIRDGNEFFNLLTNQTDHKITEYKIITPTRVYNLSRNQVECFYRNYVQSGYNLSTRDLSVHFPFFTVDDMVVIRTAFLNSFGLRKSSSIFTPHEYEELTEAQRYNLLIRFSLGKESLKDKQNLPSALEKVIEEQRVKIEKLYDFTSLAKDIVNTTILPTYSLPIIQTSKRTLAIWLADMHIGANVTQEGAVMGENIGWNNDMVIERLNKLILNIICLGNFDEIKIFNLGDAIDGMDGTTSRRDVSLPQNLTNREMAKCYHDDIIYLFDSLISNQVANKYSFYTVTQSNHGGDLEAVVSDLLVEELNQKGIEAHSSITAFGFTNIYNTQIVYGHGKDNLNQLRPLSHTLDTRTKAYIDSLLRANSLSAYFGKILVVKGDSHQYNISGCSDYNYISVGSLFGSSDWAQSNFPTRGWEINYSIFTDNETILHGSVKE